MQLFDPGGIEACLLCSLQNLTESQVAHLVLPEGTVYNACEAPIKVQVLPR
jgi:hypothetical protein